MGQSPLASWQGLPTNPAVAACCNPQGACGTILRRRVRIMVLELHIWGPAFSLPSIDPQCLAAIVYLQQVVPRDEWELIASCDDALSPTGSFPRSHL